MDIKSLVKSGKHTQVIAISDIHAEWKSAQAAIAYAKDNDMFIVYLGDIVDNGTAPGLVMDTVTCDLSLDRAAFIIGNHESKFYRKTLGNPVIYNQHQKKTLKDYADDERFYKKIVRLCTHRNTDTFHTFGSWVFTHGAAHKSIWTTGLQDKLTRDQTHLALYGEVNGKRQQVKIKDRMTNVVNWLTSKVTREKHVPILGFPVRTYEWCDDVPSGNHVIVGHDRCPMSKPKFDAKPLVYTNASGGTVYFTDTGSGKDKKGGVTGTVLDIVGDDLVFNKFKFFKN